MKFVGLISGGKDSVFNLMQCIAAGHRLVALANLAPIGTDELDSHMYQTVGHMGIDSIAKALNVPLLRRDIQGSSLNTRNLDYTETKGDEVEDLFELLKTAKEKFQVDGVGSGAILSDFQRLRVENVCSRLQLTSLAYMWQRNQKELLEEMINSGMEIMIIKVATIGLTPSKHLGTFIGNIIPHLHSLENKYGVNVCGEGGEYETFTTNAPIFKKKLIIHDFDVVETPGDVGHINFKKTEILDKDMDSETSFDDLVRGIRKPMSFVANLKEDIDNISMEPAQYSDSCESTYSWFTALSDDMTTAMASLEGQLKSKKLSLRDVISVRMYIKDMAEYALLNKAYIQTFHHNPPSRTCIEVPLQDGNILMEIAAVKSDSRKTLHVQSISHWAPANIGPYSQAVQVGDTLFLAGMIGLVPGSMELIDGIENQALLSLRHVYRVLKATNKQTSLQSIQQMVCFLSNSSDIPLMKKIFELMQENTLIIYVVVPKLPRNALVELQTISYMKLLERKSETMTIENYSITVSTKSSNRVQFAEINVCSSDLTNLANGINVLGNIINELRFKGFHFTIHYKVNVDKDDLEKLPCKCITFVPVTFINNVETILSAVGVCQEM